MNVFLALEGPGWLAIVAGAACRAAVLLIAAAAMVWALRRSAAATRHFVWSLSLFGTLVLLPLMLALPSWSWSILPSVAATRASEVSGGGSPGPAALDGTGSSTSA
jgi:hypothetical protein